jgi:hypothetical protein
MRFSSAARAGPDSGSPRDWLKRAAAGNEAAAVLFSFQLMLATFTATRSAVAAGEVCDEAGARDVELHSRCHCELMSADDTGGTNSNARAINKRRVRQFI